MEERINEVVEQPVSDTGAPKLHIKYYPAKMFRRIMANVIDFIFFVFVFILVFLLARHIVTTSPEYIKRDNDIALSKTESNLYEKDRHNRLLSINEVFINDTLFSKETQAITLKAHLEGGTGVDVYLQDKDYYGFFNYMRDFAKVDIDVYNGYITKYNEFRLSLKIDDINYFILEDEEIKINPEFELRSDHYTLLVHKCYKPYVSKAIDILIAQDSRYYSATKYISNMLMFVEIPISIVAASLIIYLLPLFIFRRGRKTFGKALYHVGLIDSRYLNPTWKRTLIRFLIVFVGEILISLVSFGVPMIISFSMMSFSKKKQSFPDYMLGLYEIDTSRSKIYWKKEEALLDEVKKNKTPVDFYVRNYD